MDKQNKFSSNLISTLSLNKWLGFVSIVLIFFSVYGLILSSPVISLFGFLAFGAIVSRIHSCKSPFDISIIGIGSLLLALAGGIWTGIFFGVTLWFATMIWQPYAEFSYHFPNAAALTITLLFFHFLSIWSGQNLVWLVIFYGLIRFVVYALILTPILRPGTIVSDFIFNISELPFNLFYNALAMQILGYVFLPLLGVSGWEVGSMFQILKSLISWI